jgi:hypothetical protein
MLINAPAAKKLASSKGLLDPPCVIHRVYCPLFNDSPLGGLPDVENLAQGG